MVARCTETAAFSPREDYFKSNKRKKRGNSRKRKRSNSNELKRKFRDEADNHQLVDITDYLGDSTFDSVELADEDEYHFDQINFDVLMEVLRCKIDASALQPIPVNDRHRHMVRVVKIMKKLHGHGELGALARDTLSHTRVFASRSRHREEVCSAQAENQRTQLWHQREQAPIQSGLQVLHGRQMPQRRRLQLFARLSRSKAKGAVQVLSPRILRYTPRYLPLTQTDTHSH